MSIEAIREKVMSFVETADTNALERLSHFIDIEQKTSADWWNDLPDEVKASIEQGIKEADAGDVISYEDFRKRHPQWFRR